MTDRHHHLRGSCSCGRNAYLITIPTPSASSATVYFDNTTASRHFHATPLQAFLRIPLEWFESHTYAFYPDETHASIRKTYHTASPPPPTPSESRTTSNTEDDRSRPVRYAQRTFCGYCGTPLTTWAEEEDPSSANTIAVTLGSLEEEDVGRLDELGLLPAEEEGETEGEGAALSQASGAAAPSRRGMPWFEDLVEDSALGRVRRRRGGHQSHNESVEWEIVEVGGDDFDEGTGGAGGSVTGKRKADDAAESGRSQKDKQRDVQMR